MPTHVVWVDIPTVDLNRAMSFYQAVLQAKINRNNNAPLAVIEHHSEKTGCCVFFSDQIQPSEHGPVIYLSVEGRIDEACAEVIANGGKVTRPPHSIEPFGIRALIRDSEGNKIALHSFS